MINNSREFDNSPVEQGVDESIVYTFDTANVGGTPTAVVIKVYDITDGYIDVTSTVMPVNSPTVTGDIIQASPLKYLTENHWYRIEVKYTPAGGNILEHFARVFAKK